MILICSNHSIFFYFQGGLNDSLDSNVDIDIETMNDEAGEQSLQDSGEQADGEDQCAPTEGVPSAENGDERSKKMFKSPIKVSQKNVGRKGRPDVIKAACKFLAERSSAMAPSTSNKREAEDQYDMYGRIWAEKIRQLDDLTREYVVRDINNLLFEAKVNPRRPPTGHYSLSPYAQRNRSSTPHSMSMSPTSTYSSESNVSRYDCPSPLVFNAPMSPFNNEGYSQNAFNNVSGSTSYTHQASTLTYSNQSATDSPSRSSSDFLTNLLP